MRGRIIRRGMAPSAGAIAALSAQGARAAVPDALVKTTIESAMSIAAGKAAAGAISATALILAKGVLRTMFVTKLKIAAATVVATASLALGAGAIERGVAIAAPTPGSGAIAQELEPASPRRNVEEPRTIAIRVLDADGEPLQGAEVFRNHVYERAGVERPRIENKVYLTDAGGMAVVSLSGTSVDLRLWASKEGFVPLHAMWAKQFQSDGDRIPKEFTFRLDRGTEIGGVVVDESGGPIEGVKVEVQDQTADRFATITPDEPGRHPVRSYSLADGADAIATDEQGRWKLGNVPPDEDLVFDPSEPNGIQIEFGPPRPHLKLELRSAIRIMTPKNSDGEDSSVGKASRWRPSAIGPRRSCSRGNEEL